MRKYLLSLFSFLTVSFGSFAGETVELKIDATADVFGFDNSQPGYWTLMVQTEDVYMYMSPQVAYEVAGIYHTADWYDLNGGYGTFIRYKGKKYTITEFELTVEQFPESDVDYTFKGYINTAEDVRFNLDLTTGYHEAEPAESIYDELGNLMNPPGEDKTFELYAWVRGGYDMGRKHYESHVRFDGQDVYFKDICPTAQTGSWVKGTYIDDKTIRILPQNYYTELVDGLQYTTKLVMWHGKKVGFDQPGTQADYYDLTVGEDEDGNMTITCVDLDDWLSVADVPMQGIYDFSSELHYTALKKYSTDIIAKQPAGRLERYSFQANVYSDEDQDFWADFGYKADVVWGDDGNVYFSTLTPDYDAPKGWIKGEYDKESGIITVLPYQAVEKVVGYDDVYTYLGNYDWDTKSYLNKPLYFKVDENGWIMATDEAEEQYPCTMYMKNGIVANLCAINQYMTMFPVKEEPTYFPCDIDTPLYRMTYSDIWEGEQERIVRVAFAFDGVYISGLSKDMPDEVVVGTLSDGRLTFQSRQLLADYFSNRYLYFNGGVFDTENDYPVLTDKLILDYDAETGVFSMEQTDDYRDANYILITYAGEMYNNIQNEQMYNVKLTPIEELKINNERLIINGDRAIYNLQGQRLNKPVKGINIINGRKVLR